MTGSTAKIRIKIGQMELEYEGDPSFLDGDIENLLTTIGELSINSGAENTTSNDSNQNTSPTDTQGPQLPTNYTTSTLATRTDVKNAADLTLCAMAFLELARGKTSNSRSEILQEMKTAGTYYNTSMSKNNSANLKRLAKQKKINEVALNTYSLTGEERKRFEGIIANIS